ncbi:substrate-binding periplasmic protein [Anaerostipes sp. MSJ-23]|uniref:substrate-binding periplasmic protein n=1 Tax=Anaerostipes sp. MSJ-23 TaxID=2841520 RepID=UPI0020A1F001|nr:transporter substrate-binding domain-containing protein [Anaerostipes sp. MSJ-23]
MKRIITLICVIGLTLCLGGCSLPWQKQKEEKTKKVQTIQSSKIDGSMKGKVLKVGVSKEMAPFSYYDEKQKKIVGFDIDILEKISQYLGFQYELEPLSMQQTEKKLKEKKIDLAIGGISITDKRQKEFSFTDSYYENSLSVVVQKDSGITDRKEIVKKTIGVEKGMSSAQYVEDYMKDTNKIKYYTSVKKIFEDLEKGKIDATLYDTTGVQYYLDHYPQTKLQALSEQLNSEESNYGIMFSKGYEGVDKFNVALQVLQTNGDYQKIKDIWVGNK